MYCPIGDLKNPFCFSFHTSNHFVANCHLLGITVCFLVVQMSDMHPKCSYPNCLGIFPEGILEQCAIEGCTNRLHHACQTEYESSQNIDLGLHKYCFSCCDRKIKGVSQSNSGKEKSQSNEGNNESRGTDLRGSLAEDTGCTTPDYNTIEASKPSPKSNERNSSSTARRILLTPRRSPRVRNSPTPRGKNLPEVIIPANEETIVPELKAQKGFKGNSVVLCPEIYLQHNTSLKDTISSDFTEMYGPYAYGRIVQVPNRKKNIPDYIIEYDKEKDLVDGVTHEDLCSTIPSSAVTKQLLKRGVERANIIDYRYKDRSKRRKRKGAGSAKAIEAETVTDSVFLGGILNENDDGTSNSQSPGGVTNESDDESLSDEGSDCELDVSAFRVDEDADEDGRSPIGDLVDNERENNFMGNEWKWNCWVDIGNDEEVDGPLETDRYNGPHGLKNGVGNRFKTIFQCIMTTTAMNIEFF